MKFPDLVELYGQYKQRYGDEVFRYISRLLSEAEEIHRRDWSLNPTRARDHGQSWRAFKGKNLEKLIAHMINDNDRVKGLGLVVTLGSKFERTLIKNLPDELQKVRKNLLIPFGQRGEFGDHLPDVDIVIYKPKTSEVVALISSKVTLRERIAQTGYWKLKLAEYALTKHIKVYFVTPDEDGDLTISNPDNMRRNRAIVETDLDGSYVMSEASVEESNKVKRFDRLVEDLKALA